MKFPNIANKNKKPAVRWLRMLWVLLLVPICYLLAEAAFFKLLGPYPFFLHRPTCNQGQVVFAKNLSPIYHEIIRTHFIRYNAPYAVLGSNLYTSAGGPHYSNVDKQIALIAEGKNVGPVLSGRRIDQVTSIYKIWKSIPPGQQKSYAWCHVVEAIVSPSGIDTKARLDYPNIWPRNKFPIPNE